VQPEEEHHTESFIGIVRSRADGCRAYHVQDGLIFGTLLVKQSAQQSRRHLALRGLPSPR
jgi:hypothetical protein